MKCFPHRERVFFCLTSSRGNLHVLLSSSVPLILPLILHCPHVKPKVHIQTDPGQQSRGYQSMKWKKKTTPRSLALPSPALWNSTAPDKADKVAWSATSAGQWSRVATMLCGGNVDLLKYNHTTLCCNGQNKLHQCWWHEFTQWINRRPLCVMCWAGFNYQSKPCELWSEFLYTVQYRNHTILLVHSEEATVHTTNKLFHLYMFCYCKDSPFNYTNTYMQIFFCHYFIVKG